MTVKGIVRYLIALVIAVVIMNVGLPMVGVPRSQLWPPSFGYGSAKGRVQGVITKKHKEDHPSPFKVGVRISMVDYKFYAPYTKPLLFGDQKTTPKKEYVGWVYTEDDFYDRVKEGQVVPIKYDPEYPTISGIDMPGAGRNTMQGSNVLSAWIAWAFGALALAWVISPLLERIALRESY
jgi:hypothetical protein